MLTTMESYLRKSRRMLHKWALDPKVQSGARVAAYSGTGFFLSAAGLSGNYQPLAMGLICAVTGWRALLVTLGAAAGYRLFWGSLGLQGVVWSAAGCLLALLLGRGKIAQLDPLLMPALAAVVTAIAIAGVAMGGAVFTPMKELADNIRQRIYDTFFYTQPRDVFTLATEGYYPQGIRQLGGPAVPREDPVMVG